MSLNMIKRFFSGLLAVFMLVMMVACAGKKSPDQKEFGVVDDIVVTPEPSPMTLDKVQHHIGNPAVLELWQKAEEARTLGDYEAAITHLERALRIDPQDAVMWSRLAEIRLNQGNTNQAENLAAKSNAMTADNPVLNYRNWLIIAKARRIEGDDIGAQEAEYTAKTFVQ